MISGYEGSKARQVLITEARPAARARGAGASRAAAPPPDERLAASRQNGAADAGHRRNAAGGADAPAARHRGGRGSARRSARSTCVRSRTRSSGCCRARPSSRASCAPTRSSSGLDPHLLVEEYRAQLRAATTSRDPAARSAGRAGARRRRRPPRVGPGLAVPSSRSGIVLLVFLLVLGLTGDEDDERGADGRHASTTKTQPAAPSKAEPEPAPAATSVALRVDPRRARPTSASTAGAGTPWSSRARSTRPQTFRGAALLRINLGKRRRAAARERQAGAVRRQGPEPIGFEFTRRREPRGAARQASGPARERTRRHRRHRHRGPDRPGAGPQRPVARRPAARARASSSPTSRSAATGRRTWRRSCASWPTRAWT